MNKIIIDNDKLSEIIVDNSDDYDIEIVSDFNLKVSVIDNVIGNIYIHSINSNYNGTIDYYLDDNSKLYVNKFSFNDCCNVIENIYLNGINSYIKYNFSSISSYNNNYKMRILHNNNGTCSYIFNRCIGNDKAEVVFDIDSILEQGNTSCIMDQNTKIMCFGDVNAKIRPNMYIDEEDVEARHGSVIGRFSDDDIFYIMSRGISYKDAVMLLIRGFILSNLNLDDERKKEVIDIINNNYK